MSYFNIYLPMLASYTNFINIHLYVLIFEHKIANK